MAQSHYRPRADFPGYVCFSSRPIGRHSCDYYSSACPHWGKRAQWLSDEATSRVRREMRSLRVLGVVAALLAGAPATAYAQWAYTAKDVHLRAGPAVDYPVVAILPAGVQIVVEGCLSDYRWCDVVAGPNRGWVYAGNIVYPYQGADVPVLTYGAVIGLGIITFSVGNYWDSYYRGSPWYPQRQLWIHRPRPGFGAGGHHPPPHAPGAGPGNRPPPPHAPAARPGTRPPPPHAPGVRPGLPRPSPQGQGPGGSQRPPQGQAPGSGPHPPRAQGPGDGKRQQPGH